MTDSSPIVMVTGAAGNVGRALLATLASGGHRIERALGDEQPALSGCDGAHPRRCQAPRWTWSASGMAARFWGVSMIEGRIALTRMPSVFNSSAKLSIRRCTALFAPA